MHFDVSLERLLGSVRLGADGALVEPLAQVGHLMQFQDVIVGERFPADVASVRPFTCGKAQSNWEFNLCSTVVQTKSRVATHPYASVNGL